MKEHEMIERLSQSLGVDVNDFEFNARFFRYPKPGKARGDDSLWAVGRSFLVRKSEYYIIHCGDWTTGETQKITSCKEGEAISSYVKKELARAHAELKQAVQEETLRKNIVAANEVRELFQNSKELTHHAYLDTKKVGIYDLKQDHNSMLIPIYHDKKLVNYQRIYWSNKTDKFEKRFHPGAMRKKTYGAIGDVHSAKFIYAAEGYSTAASIHMATGVPVLITWNTTTMPQAIEHFKELNPTVKIVIAADNDESCAGELWAQKCCDYNTSYILCPIKGDFNDLHVTNGIESVKEALKTNKAPDGQIILLGIDNAGFCHYFSTELQHLYSLSPASHERNHLLQMAPAKYWGGTFKCYKKKNDGTLSGEVDYAVLADKLFEEQRKIGKIDMSKVRGLGVHLDNGEIAANFGDRIYYKGREIPIYDSIQETNFFYHGSTRVELDLNDQMTDQEGLNFISAVKRMKFKTKYDFIITTGWVAQAQIFGGLSWRPFLWVTGGRGSGKSTMLAYLSDFILFSLKIQNSTEAGVRQKLGSDAKAVIYDEAESDDEDTKKRMKRIMELARPCSSNNSAASLRGTPGGVAKENIPNATFCMGSIQIPDLKGADRSRYFIVEMDKEVEAPQWAETEKELNDLIHSGIASRMFARMLVNFPQIKKNINITKDYLAKLKKLDQRMIDQVAPIIVGYVALTEMADISPQTIDNILSELELENSEYVHDNQIQEPEECLDAILTSLVDRQMSLTVMDFLHHETNEARQRAIENYGLKIYKNSLAVHPCNQNLKALLRNTPFHDIGKLLRRHPNSVPASNGKHGHSLRIAGKRRNCVLIERWNEA